MLSKDEIRKQMLAKRKALSIPIRKEVRDKIMEKLFSLKEFLEAKVVCFYISEDEEVATKQMIKEVLNLGKKILVPVTNSHIELFEFTSFEDLVLGKFGVMEPKTRIKASGAPDLIIVTALAFDLDCHRLGYGKGYYDKFLKTTKAKRVGICYDINIIEILPRHEHDEQMDLIITEKRSIKK